MCGAEGIVTLRLQSDRLLGDGPSSKPSPLSAVGLPRSAQPVALHCAPLLLLCPVHESKETSVSVLQVFC